MRIAFTPIFVLIFYFAHAQIGINFRYGNMNPKHWEDQIKYDRLFSNSKEFGIDYWFRLKNYRVEFSPEAYLNTSSSNDNTYDHSLVIGGVSANTNFYILDFIGDCDCPTFSKDGNFFTKGIHLSVAPFVEYGQKSIINSNGQVDEDELKDKSFSFGASIGIGLDIGITDLLTITPYFRYKINPTATWNGLESHVNNNEIKDKTTLVSYPLFGIRLGFRPDYIREQNRFKRRRR